MNEQPTPPKLRKAKAAAVTAAAIAATAALTIGGTTAASTVVSADRNDVAISAPVQQHDVDLAAVAGFYGVGPIFWVANALGITPENVVQAIVGQLDIPELNQAVGLLFDALGAVVETDAPGPLPDDVYNAVNGLDYTTDLVFGLVPAPLRNVQLGAVTAPLVNTLLGTDFSPGDTIADALEALANEVPILKQRRAVIFSEGFGGITTSLAYRDMIEAVTGDSADWEPGVTGQWLIFVNNPSRPGGGMAALFTPFTNMFGLNLSTPDGGSYTNDPDDPTKILNTSVLDITAAYNMWSDAPTTLNPLAWANAAAGGFLITYLIPDNLDVTNTNLLTQVLPTLLNPLPGQGAIANGLGVMLDPTGGQGTRVIPIVGDLIDLLDGIPLIDVPHLDGIQGESFFVTYDSGNLPILEPLDLLPRLLGLVGVNVPQPFHNSIEDALRMAINTGYQDVDPDDLTRGFDMGGDQALIWRSALTPSQQFDAGWKISNTLLDGIQDNLLNPVAWTPEILGQAGFNDAAKAIIQNAIFMAASQFINEALDAGQDLANEGFTALRDALKPMLDIADQLNAQAEGAIDDVMQVDKLDPAPAPRPEALTTTSGPSARLMSLSEDPKDDPKDIEAPAAKQVQAKVAVEEEAPKSLKDAAPDTDLLADKDLEKNAKSVAVSLKEQRQQVRAELREARDEVRGNLKEARNELRDQVKETRNNIRDGLKDAGDSVRNAVSGNNKSSNSETSSISSSNESDSGSKSKVKNDKQDKKETKTAKDAA